ncbi:putative raffinose synthase protein Sip1 [Talaromyces proteolyticus]|uniref:Raffinose synthase protein Sip1 n=1 Tax=Talaromyces proteolyticus TaxID=1131652 RepID=A0AAD4L024_9EURO|nr:putative raffinose synthase protein Sip1 [Talaromyces proteolyticus]KAH8703291.1 putative raffinose synthase protein Sip1 [Talaromyces proteolyticus]
MSVSDIVAISRSSSLAARESIARELFARPSQTSLFARVTCHPPLAEVTCIRRSCQSSRSTDEDKIRFTVVLFSSTSFPEQDWEVEIWHNIWDSTQWGALPLAKCDPENSCTIIGDHHVRHGFYHYTFSSEIDLPTQAGKASFTLRYKSSCDADWHWASQRKFIKDGDLVWGPKYRVLKSISLPTDSNSAPQISPRDEFTDYIENLSTEVDIQSRKSEAPGALLWSITGNVTSAKGDYQEEVRLRLDSQSCTCAICVWLTEDAILCSFLRSDGLNLMLFAVSGVNNVLTTLRSSDMEEIVVDARNDNVTDAKFQVLASVGEDFEVCMSALIYEARKVVRDFITDIPLPVVSDIPKEPDSPIGDDIVVVDKDVRTQWLADWYEGLTYCTWNGIGPKLSEDKILHALDSLKANGIKVSNLIIDDNWQSIDNQGETQWRRGWMNFEASTEGFPSGLRHAATRIRKEHPDIEHIGVWHALMGYWGGISPEGELAKKYKTKEVRTNDPVAGGTMLAIDPDDINRFYGDFYEFLTSCGIDAIKTDAQFFLDSLDNAEYRRCFISSYQDAWSIASLRYFSTRAISCMSMTPQHIFHSQIPTNKPSILLRNSDDFFPDVVDSHPWHVFCNAHNALLTAHLNVIPDWDMFQTDHPYGSFHAAARCVSGGPIYITDKPGEHNVELIHQITAPTTRGTTTILRPSVPGRTLDVYHNYNEGNILRIGTYSGWARTGSGILGLFNISPADTSSIVPLTSFPGVEASSSSNSYDRYIIRSFTTGMISEVMTPSGPHAMVSLSFAPKGWEILTAYPVRSFTLEGSRGCTAASSMISSMTHVVVLGLLGKMTGVAALVNSDVCVIGNGRLRFDISLKALGVLGIYHSGLDSRDIDEHVMVMVSGLAVPRRTVWKDGDKVLAIDVLHAWTSLGLDAGWSNEVRVQVFIN